MKILKGETYKQRLLIDYLQSPESIRKSCNILFNYAELGQLKHFTYHPENLPAVTEFVIQVMRRNYPNLDIPYHSRWRHFETGGIDRRIILFDKVTGSNAAKSAIELVIVSILLDAGAGTEWQYKDYLSNSILSKSEGLAAASFNLFMQGLFSADHRNLYQADADGLLNLTENTLSAGLQVAPQNSLVGIKGRLELLHRLGICVADKDEYFAPSNDVVRLGNILDYWTSKSVNNSLSMRVIFSSLLDALGDIWPSRYKLDGVTLGDVWPDSLCITDLNPQGFVPFHKLTQWLCYSLIEPLELIGITVTDIDLLTGLPEYRNGGLFVDMKVLVPIDPAALFRMHAADSEFIVEWRAMTVILLDKLAASIRENLGLSVAELPLLKVLQGGTWSAGREIALQLRADGSPPFKYASDGTLF